MSKDETRIPYISITPKDQPAATSSSRPWWKPYHRTCVIFLLAAGSIALLAVLIFGGRDGSGDAAGQGLAGAFEAAFFVLSVFLIVSIALISWLTRYFRTQTIIMGILAFVVLVALLLMW